MTYVAPPTGLTVDDIDVFEINEAFASQVTLKTRVSLLKATNHYFTLLMLWECFFSPFSVAPCCLGGVLRGEAGDPAAESEPQWRRHRPGSPAGLHRHPPGGDTAQ